MRFVVMSMGDCSENTPLMVVKQEVEKSMR